MCRDFCEYSDHLVSNHAIHWAHSVEATIAGQHEKIEIPTLRRKLSNTDGRALHSASRLALVLLAAYLFLPYFTQPRADGLDQFIAV